MARSTFSRGNVGHPLPTLAMAVLSLLPVVGCQQPSDDIVPVTGVVTLDGVPLANAEIYFRPQVLYSGDGPDSMAISRDDGTFELQVVGSNRRGAVIGLHQVEVRLGSPDELIVNIGGSEDPNMAQSEEVDILPECYNRRSEVFVNVRKTAPNHVELNLSSKATF